MQIAADEASARPGLEAGPAVSIQTLPRTSPDWDAIVIGAGFGGLAMAHALKKVAGLRFLVLEKSHRLGGTWRDNRYPGCACDIPSHLYSLSFAPNPAWSRMFAPQPEILAYMDKVAGDIGLADHLRLGHAVDAARWVEEGQYWSLALSDGSTLTSRSLITAMGVLHHPELPDIAGQTDFAGAVLHSAVWDHATNLAGKRVVVIGTGASAIQIVPEVAKVAASVMVFQRTPPWIAPKFDRPIEAERQENFAKRPLSRRWFRGQLWWAHEKRARGFTSQHPGVLAKTEAMCRRHLERQVREPALRARLTPNYSVGCKRLLISNDYYPALQLPQVRLVTARIARITATGVIDDAGAAYEADVLIYCTGFDAQGALSRLPITGMEGRRLQEVWDETGKSAYLGTTVGGFPNLFTMTGPNAGSGHTSQLFMLEAQAHYIARAQQLMQARAITRMEVRRSAQAAFEADMQARLGASVWHGGGCQSWYLDKSGRNTVLWPSLSLDFWWRTRRVRLGDYWLGRNTQDEKTSFLKKRSKRNLDPGIRARHTPSPPGKRFSFLFLRKEHFEG